MVGASTPKRKWAVIVVVGVLLPVLVAVDRVGRASPRLVERMAVGSVVAWTCPLVSCGRGL